MTRSTIDHITELLLNEMAAASGIEWDTYEEFRAQMRHTRPIVAGLLKQDPGMPLNQMLPLFIAAQ